MVKSFSKLAVFLLIAALVAVAGLTACTSAPEPTPPPTVTINSPQDGVELPAGDVTVSISVSNFNIVPKLGQSSAAGEGHIHYYLDAEPPVTPGQPAVSAPGTYAATPATSHTWENVKAGAHTFSVQLVNNNHTPLEPPVVAQVTVNLRAPPPPALAPSLKILSPVPNATLPAGPVTVKIEVTNFSIVNKLGQSSAAGEGHIHYYLDAEPPVTPGQPAVSAPG
ncbi:MAG: hypothetical protein HY325_01635, partial [Chloroflexi bacterium]|nr:hypothetical protein [Chloroflexota bacterium]